MNEAEVLKIKIEGIKEMLEDLNATLPFAGLLSVSIVKKYLSGLEEKLRNINNKNNG